HVDGWVAMVPKQERAVNKVYTYDLDEELYRRIVNDIGSVLDSEWLAGGELNIWLAGDYVIPAYNQGIAQTVAALGAQSATVRLSQQAAQAIMYEPAYLKRIGLVRARVFEEM